MQIKKGETNPRAHLCQSCVGWCCYRFTIAMSIKDNKPNWDFFKEEGDDQKNPGDLAFIRKNFKEVKRVRVLGELFDVTFTCKQYDVKKHICKTHKTRPVLCQRYVCDESEGLTEPPGKDIFAWQHRAMKRDGVI